MSQSNEPRYYLFGIDGNPESKEGVEAFFNAPVTSTPNDFRVIIGLCCTLILRYGSNIDPEVIACVKRIQEETGLQERLN